MKRSEKVVTEISETKRKKIEPSLSRRTVSLAESMEIGDVVSRLRLKVPAPQPADYNKIQQAKNFAVAQAQQDGCTSSFRIFDSVFGNFLVPVIPTRADLTG